MLLYERWYVNAYKEATYACNACLIWVHSGSGKKKKNLTEDKQSLLIEMENRQTDTMWLKFYGLKNLIYFASC